MKIKVEVKYLFQTKGIKQNKNCWDTQTVFYTKKEVLKLYNFYKCGANFRIVKEITKTTYKVVAKK